MHNVLYTLKYLNKNKFDFKHNNYTTTENAYKTPDENVRQLQRELNESGYTDKFGEPLKEDGIYGGKTAYADDRRKTNNPITDNNRYKTATINGKEYKAEHLLATKDDLQPKMWGKSEVKSASTNYDSQLKYYKNKSSNTDDNSDNFDYNTRLSYNQNYDKMVEILQNRLEELGYLDMSVGGWGYYGPKTIEAVNRYKKDNELGNTGKDEGVVGKDTWKSLGLLYREQIDIDNGVKIITSGRKQYFDISEAVSKALYKARDEFSKNKQDVDWFIEKVKNEGDWNIKRDAEVWQKTLNISENSYYVDGFFLYGNYINKEDLGNITYGYLGKAAGFPDDILIIGSLGYHMRYNLMKDIQNELDDQDRIRTGIKWYNGFDISAKII